MVNIVLHVTLYLITTSDNGNVQSHDQDKSKLNSTIIANNSASTLPDDKMKKKSPIKKNNVATTKNK